MMILRMSYQRKRMRILQSTRSMMMSRQIQYPITVRRRRLSPACTPPRKIRIIPSRPTIGRIIQYHPIDHNHKQYTHDHDNEPEPVEPEFVLCMNSYTHYCIDITLPGSIIGIYNYFPIRYHCLMILIMEKTPELSNRNHNLNHQSFSHSYQPQQATQK
jgi:hypothetical protein